MFVCLRSLAHGGPVVLVPLPASSARAKKRTEERAAWAFNKTFHFPSHPFYNKRPLRAGGL